MSSSRCHERLSDCIASGISAENDVTLFPLAIDAIKNGNLLRHCCSEIESGQKALVQPTLKAWSRQIRELAHSDDLTLIWKALACINVSCESMLGSSLEAELVSSMQLITSVIVNVKDHESVQADALDTAVQVLKSAQYCAHRLHSALLKDNIESYTTAMTKIILSMLSDGCSPAMLQTKCLNLLRLLLECMSEKKVQILGEIKARVLAIILHRDDCCDRATIDQASQVLSTIPKLSSKTTSHQKWRESFDVIYAKACEALTNIERRQSHPELANAEHFPLDVAEIQKNSLFERCLFALAGYILNAPIKICFIPVYDLLVLAQRGLSTILSMPLAGQSLPLVGMVDSIFAVMVNLSRLSPSMMLAHVRLWWEPFLALAKSGGAGEMTYLCQAKTIVAISDTLGPRWVPRHDAALIVGCFSSKLGDMNEEMQYWSLRALHSLMSTSEHSMELSKETGRILGHAAQKFCDQEDPSERLIEAWQDILVLTASDTSYGLLIRNQLLHRTMPSPKGQLLMDNLLHPSFPAVTKEMSKGENENPRKRSIAEINQDLTIKDDYDGATENPLLEFVPPLDALQSDESTKKAPKSTEELFGSRLISYEADMPDTQSRAVTDSALTAATMLQDAALSMADVPPRVSAEPELKSSKQAFQDSDSDSDISITINMESDSEEDDN